MVFVDFEIGQNCIFGRFKILYIDISWFCQIFVGIGSRVHNLIAE